MAGARPSAGGPRQSLGRVVDRLTSPTVYLAVLGGLQVAVIWTVQTRYGAWLFWSMAGGWLGLLLLLAMVPRRWGWKLAAGSLLGLLSSVVPTMASIAVRTRVGLTTEHDGLLQVESAIDRLLKGQSIYGVDWSGTPMAAYPWNLTPGGNPALHHLAYFPLTVLVGVPFRIAAEWLAAPFDYRTVLVAFALLALASVLALPIEAERRFMVICVIFIGPLISLYLWPGRNDIEFLAVVLLAIALLARGRLVLAGLTLGIAVALKPFAWPAVPFYLLLLVLRRRSGAQRSEIWMSSLAMLSAPLLTIMPFLLANPGAFWSDIVLYSSGGIPDAYPIAGFGFSALLYQAGIIAHRTDSFPFTVPQLAAMTPVLVIGARAFMARPTLSRWMAGYVSLLLAFTFFARFFNDNYAAVVIALFLCVRPLGDRWLVPSGVAVARPLAA